MSKLDLIVLNTTSCTQTTTEKYTLLNSKYLILEGNNNQLQIFSAFRNKYVKLSQKRKAKKQNPSAFLFQYTITAFYGGLQQLLNSLITFRIPFLDYRYAIRPHKHNIYIYHTTLCTHPHWFPAHIPGSRSEAHPPRRILVWTLPAGHCL